MMHLEVLPPDQQNALRQLGPAAKDQGFYLGGGTAVAVHLGHRQSIDLDWFTGTGSISRWHWPGTSKVAGLTSA